MSAPRDRWRVAGWWFAVAVLVFLSGVMRGAMQDLRIGIVTPHRLIAASYVTISLAILVGARQALAPLAARVWPVLLLPVLALLSTLWSASPIATLRGAVMLAGTTAFAITLAMRFTLAEQVRLLALVLGLAVAASAAVALVDPQTGVMTGIHAGAWRGLYSHKNGLGASATLGLLACVFLCLGSQRGHRIPPVLGVAICTGVLVASTSRTALAAAGVCGAATSVALLLGAVPGPRRVRILAATTAAGLIVAAVIAWRADTALALLGRDATLTGRTYIWSVVLDTVRERPMLGHGYGTFWRTDGAAALAERIGWHPAHAHNGLLDLGLELGGVGAVLFLVPFVYFAVRAGRYGLAGGTPIAWWPGIYLLFYVLINTVETSLVRQHALLWVLYVAMVCTISRPAIDAPAR